jgi:hypothetical protein
MWRVLQFGFALVFIATLLFGPERWTSLAGIWAAMVVCGMKEGEK